ncbi:PPM-type phosphatase domain-containing protein OS=Streptomyces antimycoticus OX=68175 GN=SANT12839_081760 PE=4 SV=1 [Streptomyces antimycoticus]
MQESLDVPNPLGVALRTGSRSSFPAGRIIRRWPQGAESPWIDQLGSHCAVSVSPVSPLGHQPLGAWWVTYDSEHHSSPHERALMGTLS